MTYVVIAGGGIAGSSLGGVLTRSGLGVLVVEKERRFRDRIRGELTWPWGHSDWRPTRFVNQAWEGTSTRS
jgi:flavin-dependent dehydrogenase